MPEAFGDVVNVDPAAFQYRCIRVARRIGGYPGKTDGIRYFPECPVAFGDDFPNQSDFLKRVFRAFG